MVCCVCLFLSIYLYLQWLRAAATSMLVWHQGARPLTMAPPCTLLTEVGIWGIICGVSLSLYPKHTVYAIIFAYSYFRDFGLGAGIRKGLISWFSDVFITIHRQKLKWKFSRGLTCEIRENKTTTKITTYTVIICPHLLKLNNMSFSLWANDTTIQCHFPFEPMTPPYNVIFPLSQWHHHTMSFSLWANDTTIQCHFPFEPMTPPYNVIFPLSQWHHHTMSFSLWANDTTIQCHFPFEPMTPPYNFIFPLSQWHHHTMSFSLWANDTTIQCHFPFEPMTPPYNVIFPLSQWHHHTMSFSLWANDTTIQCHFPFEPMTPSYNVIFPLSQWHHHTMSFSLWANDTTIQCHFPFEPMTPPYNFTVAPTKTRFFSCMR